jgi:hypothetical protein
VTAKASRIELNKLSKETIKEFLEDSKYKPRTKRV